MLGNVKETELFYRQIWPHREAVLRTAVMLVRNTATAEDLAQEVMIKAFKSIRQFAEGTNARAWLMSILRNVRVDWLRSEMKHIKNVSLNHSVDQDSESQTIVDHQVFETNSDFDTLIDRLGDSDLIDALQHLPEEIRWTLMLVEVEGLDHAQVAEILEVPIGTIKSRSSRGRVMLRTILEPLARERGWAGRRQSTDDGKVAQSENGGLV